MNEAAPAPVTELENARDRVIAVIGNPNTGKSTLFNALTGLRQKTANYPGVTVERHTGHITLSGQKVTLVDLPGAYSIAAQSPDEMVAIDVLLGHVEDLPRPRAILAVVDATNLRRNLFLVTQLAELGLPMVIGLNMTDLAAAKGIEVDITALGKALGAQVVALSAARGIGLDDLRAALARAIDAPSPPPLRVLPTVNEAAADLWQRLRAAGSHLSEYEIERALIDAHGAAERRFELSAGETFHAELLDLRARLSAGSSLAAMEATARYGLINALIAKVERRQPPRVTVSDRIDSVTNHPVIGSLLFLLVMAAVFQAVFSWAAPLMDLIDGWASGLGEVVRAALPPGAISSLLVDGVIAGVGGVVIFLPQIMILFAFIIVLEDSGYMPRVAFMVDRLMRSVGLSGQSFIPMLSSFASAVPGIMATRVIPERRDRIATILAAPFMTCSARLPIYALLIGAFIPDTRYLGGLINLQGMVLLGLYLLGIVGGIFTAAEAHGTERPHTDLHDRVAALSPAEPVVGRDPARRTRPHLSGTRRHRDLLGGRACLGTGVFPAATGSRRTLRGRTRRTCQSAGQRCARPADRAARQPPGECLAGTELAGPRRPLRGARLRTARLGLEGFGGGDRRVPRAGSGDRRTEHDLLGR